MTQSHEGAASCGCTRRRLLGVGGAVAAGAALSACGGGDAPTASAPTTAADGSIRVPTADTAVGGATYYEGAKLWVAQPAQGEFKAYDAICPHQGCPASELEDARIVCPCHSSVFDPATGDVVSGPAPKGLAVLETSVDGSDLVIRG